MEIVFEEGEIIKTNTWRDYSAYEWQVPVFAVFNGKRHFMYNANVHYKFSSDKELMEQKKQMLILTAGKYFKDYGFCDNPMDFLLDILSSKKRFSYGMTEEHVFSQNEELGYYDFKGNLEKISCAFHYRIYDDTFAKEIKKLVHKVFVNNYD